MWLDKAELVLILRDHAKLGFGLSTSPPQRPPTGTILLYDRKTTRVWRKDGHQWRQKNDSHEKLKINGAGVIGCCYNTHRSLPGFNRRGYWLLGSPGLLLVHYRACSAPSPANPPQNTNKRRAIATGAGATMAVAGCASAVDAKNCVAWRLTLPLLDFAPDWGFRDVATKLLVVVGRGAGGVHLRGSVVAHTGAGAIAKADRVANGVFRVVVPAARATSAPTLRFVLTDGEVATAPVLFQRVARGDASATPTSAPARTGDAGGLAGDEATLTQNFASLTLRDMGINTSDIEDTAVSDEVFNQAAERIQRQFRAWLHRRHEAAKKVQAFVRGALVRRAIRRKRKAEADPDKPVSEPWTGFLA